MARRIKLGMTYVEVLGGILIVALIGTVVTTAVGVSLGLERMGQRSKAVTWSGEQVMTGVIAALEESSWMILEALSDLEAFMAVYDMAHLLDSQYTYQLSLWPVTAKAGKTWQFSQDVAPRLVLATGSVSLSGGDPLEMMVLPEASYGFDANQYGGQFIGEAFPRNVLGELEVRLAKRGSYYQGELIKGRISGKASLDIGSDLANHKLTLTLTDQKGVNNRNKLILCIVDGKELVETDDQPLNLQIVNNSTAQVLLKMIGDEEVMTSILVQHGGTGGKVSSVYQPGLVGEAYTLAVLQVGDEAGKVHKSLMALVSIGEEVEDEN